MIDPERYLKKPLAEPPRRRDPKPKRNQPFTPEAIRGWIARMEIRLMKQQRHRERSARIYGAKFIERALPRQQLRHL